MKKILMFTATVTCAMALTTGTASAHFCYNAKQSTNGTEQVAKNSKAFATYADSLASWGLCADGLAYVEANGPASIPLNVPVNTRATMGGGAIHKGQDPQGIDHIDATDAEWDAFDAVITHAFEQVCPMPAD